MYLKIISFLLLQVCFSDAVFPHFDEDIKLPSASTVILENNPNRIYLKIIGNFSGCRCIQMPNEFTCCSGAECKSFPTNLTVIEKMIKFKLTSTKILKRNDFAKLTNVEIMEIESNTDLIEIEAGIFQNMSKLTNLIISSNTNLKYLEENVFDGLMHLEWLLLLKNGFVNVIDVTKALSPKYVPKLDLLNLSENKFNKINSYEFEPMIGSNLTQLNLYLCQIEYLHPDCLEPLRNLHILRLGQNLFSVKVLIRFLNRTIDLGVPLNWINLFETGLTSNNLKDVLQVIARSNISYLHIANNHFEYIDDNLFPYMPNLIKLDLRKDLIFDITTNAFQNLPNLKILLLGENLLMGVPQGILIPPLKELDLAGNSNDQISSPFFNIGTQMFENMTQLENLQLAYNNLGVLFESAFIGLNNLQNLNLKNTFLSEIKFGTFAPLVKLKILNLINNPFSRATFWTSDLFKGLDQLEILLLDGCSIQNLTVAPSLFEHTPNLKHLALERNQIHTISSTQFQKLPNLETLDLSKNELIPWSYRLLPNNNLKQLCVSHNKLTYVTTQMLDDWKDLEMLYLMDNPFSCDCNLYQISDWFKYNDLPPTQGGDCTSPKEKRNLTIFTYITLLIEDECVTFWILNKALMITIALLLVLFILLIILGCVYRQHIQYLIFLVRIKLNRHQISSPHNFLYDAFVSYCNEDSKFVSEMIEVLERSEPYLKLCVYERDFQIGSMISESIVQNLIASKRTVLVVSNAFAKSQWCRWETQLAEYHQIFFRNDNSDGPDDTLIIIRLGYVDKEYITPILKYLMKTRIYLQWNYMDVNKQRVFWEKLKTTLSSAKSVE